STLLLTRTPAASPPPPRHPSKPSTAPTMASFCCPTRRCAPPPTQTAPFWSFYRRPIGRPLPAETGTEPHSKPIRSGGMRTGEHQNPMEGTMTNDLPYPEQGLVLTHFLTVRAV